MRDGPIEGEDPEYGQWESIELDNLFKKFEGLSFDRVAAMMCSLSYWLEAIPLMMIPQEQRNRFFKSYNDTGKHINRVKAINGLVWVNNIKELIVIHAAKKIHNERKTGEISNDSIYISNETLAGYLIQCVADPEGWKSVKRLSDLLKKGGDYGSLRGGEDSYEGQLWREFCQIHLSTKKLPTKKQLRETLNLATDSQRSDFSKWLKNLGLDGIPEA